MKTCIICSADFAPEAFRMRAKTCSPKCALENEKRVTHEHYIKRKAARKQFLQLRGLA